MSERKRAIVNIFYNRPQYAEEVLDGLRQQVWEGRMKKYSYFCFLDGPKKESDEEAVEDNKHFVVDFLRELDDYFVESTIIERPRNYGCDDNIFDALAQLFLVNKMDEVIVLEEDIVPLKGFLEWMEWGLDNLVGKEIEHCCKKCKVFNVTGFSEPRNKVEDPTSYFLARWFTPWGWATSREAINKSWYGDMLLQKKSFDKPVHNLVDMAVKYHPHKETSQFIKLDEQGNVAHVSGGWDNLTNIVGEIEEKYQATPVVPRTKNIGRIGLHQNGTYLWPELIERKTTTDDYDLVSDGFHEVA